MAYSAAVHIQFTSEEIKHIANISTIDYPLYIEVTGNWKTGLSISNINRLTYDRLKGNSRTGKYTLRVKGITYGHIALTAVGRQLFGAEQLHDGLLQVDVKYINKDYKPQLLITAVDTNKIAIDACTVIEDLVAPSDNTLFPLQNIIVPNYEELPEIEVSQNFLANTILRSDPVTVDFSNTDVPKVILPTQQLLSELVEEPIIEPVVIIDQIPVIQELVPVEAVQVPVYVEPVVASPVYVEPVVVVAPAVVEVAQPIIVQVVDKKIKDLKDSKLELNEMLKMQPKLFVVLRNNRLYLEQEIEVMEEI